MGIERAGPEGMYIAEFVAQSSPQRRAAKCKSLRKLRRLGSNLNVLSLLYLPTLEAGSANAHPPVRPLHYRAHRAQIHVPAPLGDVMGVADIVSKLRPFAAHFAYACHVTNSRIGSDSGGHTPQKS